MNQPDLPGHRDADAGTRDDFHPTAAGGWVHVDNDLALRVFRREIDALRWIARHGGRAAHVPFGQPFGRDDLRQVGRLTPPEPPADAPADLTARRGNIPRNALDYDGAKCLCGDVWWQLAVTLDRDGQITGHLTTATCVSCGSITKVTGKAAP